MKSKVLKSMMAGAVLAALTACGGGGGDSESGGAEGLWGGTTSTAEQMALFVLDDGQTWGIYGSESGNYGGILQGQLSSTGGGAVSGNLLDFSLTGTNQSNLNISGTVRSGASMSLMLNSNSTAMLSFDGAYNTPASLTQIAGTYSGIAIARGAADESISVVIDPSGNITTTSADHPLCAGTGRVSLRGGNKAIVNFSIQFTGNNCLFATGSAISGVGAKDGDSIVAIGMNPARTQGLLLVADMSVPR